VLVSKYADHLPLYRQSQIFDREGLDLDRSTLADWVGKTTALLEPLADAIGRHVLSAEAIFADDTPVSMLAPGTGKTQTARLWTYARDERPGAARATGRLVSLLRRPQGPASQGSPRPLPRLDACRRLCRVRGSLPLRRHPRGRLHGPCQAQVRRHPPSQGSPIAEEAIAGSRNSMPSRRRPEALHRTPRRTPQTHAAPVFDDLEVWLAMQLTTISGKSPSLPPSAMP
jgi:hypothetical protein